MKKTPLVTLILFFAVLIASVRITAAAETSRPNILFIIFDDWNGSTHAGAYGCNWVKTPNFDRIAREGVFEKHALARDAVEVRRLDPSAAVRARDRKSVV